MKKIGLIIYFLMDLCLGINAKTITVPKNIKYIDIKAYTEVCYQKSPIDNLESLQFDFFDYKKIIREKGVIYIKFDVNHEKLTKKYYLNTVYFDSVEVFTKNKNKWVKINQKSGFLIPMNQKTVKNGRTSLVPIPVFPNQNNTFIVALHSVTKSSALASDVSAKIGLHLYTSNGLSIFNSHKNIGFFLSGVLLFMMLINSGIYILGKKKSYCYLVLYNLFFLLAIVFTNGLLQEIGLINNTEINRTTRLMAWCIFPIFYLAFGKNYLQLKTKLSWAYTMVTIVLVLNILCLTPFLFSNLSLVFTLLPYIFPLNALVLFICSLFLAKQNFVPAKFMIFASSILFLGYLGIFMGIKTQIIPFVYTEVFTIIFLLIELSVFSIAVFSDFRQTEKKVLLEIQKRLEIEQELNQKNRALISANLKMESNQEQLSNILANDNVTVSEIKKQIKQLKTNDKNWENTFTHFQEVHPLFFDALAQVFPNLTSNDLKLCAFLKMNLSTKEIANLTGVTEIAVSKSRNRLRKKLNMPLGENIIQFINQNIDNSSNV